MTGSAGEGVSGLFGWLHRPAPGDDRAIGLVVCSPFGFEAVCAHRSLRQLAEMAAVAGVPALRFDYAGCGHSVGDEWSPGNVPRWLASVHAAVDALKLATGVTQVCLLGVRLGATLAALAANGRDDVATVVAVAPVVRGRTYLRELKVLDQTGAAATLSAPGEGLEPGAVESAGFVLTADTAAAVGAIDLRGPLRVPARRLLIVTRDDLPESPEAKEWLALLQGAGAEVALLNGAGYASMMDDPQRAEAPHELFTAVLRWLDPGASGQVGARNVAPWGSWVQTLGHGSTVITETITPINADGTPLFAVLAQPAAPAPSSPAILMLNSGAIHAIGPQRLWVRLARRWAARGAMVLRLDLAGLGDSPTRPGTAPNVVYAAHALDDVAAAVRWLRERAGAREVHLLGLCSGAYHALKAAVANHPVDSALMINPLTFFWDKGAVLTGLNEHEVEPLASKFRGKLFTREPWLKLWRGELHVRLILAVLCRRAWNALAPGLMDLARGVRWPLRRDLARELGQACDHGVTLRFVFAEGAPGQVLLRNQSGDAMRQLQARGAASIDIIAGADHTFTRHAMRERLVPLLDELVLGARRAPARRG